MPPDCATRRYPDPATVARTTIQIDDGPVAPLLRRHLVLGLRPCLPRKSRLGRLQAGQRQRRLTPGRSRSAQRGRLLPSRPAIRAGVWQSWIPMPRWVAMVGIRSGIGRGDRRSVVLACHDIVGDDASSVARALISPAEHPLPPRPDPAPQATSDMQLPSWIPAYCGQKRNTHAIATGSHASTSTPNNAFADASALDGRPPFRLGFLGVAAGSSTISARSSKIAC